MTCWIIDLVRAAAALSLLILCGVLFAAEEESPAPEETEEPLPKLTDLELPTAQALLREKPFDWVVLSNLDTLVVELVSPRPETLKKLEEEIQRLLNVRTKNSAEAEELRLKRLELRKLPVILWKAENTGPAEPDYTLETRLIHEIIYHEDLVLRRASRAIDEGLTAQALELLVYLDRRFHNWPGYDAQVHRLLLKETQVRLERNDLEGAFRYAEELYAKAPEYSGLSGVAGQAVDRLISQAVERHDYRQARHFLGRMAARDAGHAVVEKWRTELAARSAAQVQEARAASERGDGSQATTLVDEAARIWPETPNLRDVHREMTNRYPILRVGVLQLSTEEPKYAFPTLAEARMQGLTTIPWFETARFNEAGPRYVSVPCEGWEPDDLGRQIRFTLRRQVAEWETRPQFTSASLFAELASRTNPASTEYDERLASYVAGVSTPSPFELIVRFRRPPLRPEGLFRFACRPAGEDLELNADLPDLSATNGLRFRLHDFDAANVRYVRLRPEPNAVKQRHVAEIHEHRYDNWDVLLQGLQRGEISMIPRVAPLDLAALKEDSRYFVLPYAQPLSHVIQFHPRSRPLQNGQLRRALLYGLPRGKILDEQLLGGAPESAAFARLAASPFTIDSPGNNRLLPQPEYDPILAAGLSSTARKELGGSIPPLRITCPLEAEIRRSVDAMIAAWKRLGIDVAVNAARSDEWDLAYRTVQFREPLIDVWPFLTADPAASVAALDPFPERVRRQVMELERATDRAAAYRVLHRLQSDLLFDAWWIPLWETDEYFLARKNVTGLPDQLVAPYQGIERWIVQSWYPTEAP